MNSVVRFPTSVHLKRIRCKAAHDKSSIAVRRTIQLAVLIGPQLMAGDENAIGMRMAVQVHVFRLSECGRYRVVASRLVGWIPVLRSRAGGDVQHTALLGQLGVIDRLSRLLRSGVDRSYPAGHRDATACNGARSILGRD